MNINVPVKVVRYIHKDHRNMVSTDVIVDDCTKRYLREKYVGEGHKILDIKNLTYKETTYIPSQVLNNEFIQRIQDYYLSEYDGISPVCNL